MPPLEIVPHGQPPDKAGRRQELHPLAWAPGHARRRSPIPHDRARPRRLDRLQTGHTYKGGSANSAAPVPIIDDDFAMRELTHARSTTSTKSSPSEWAPPSTHLNLETLDHQYSLRRQGKGAPGGRDSDVLPLCRFSFEIAALERMVADVYLWPYLRRGCVILSGVHHAGEAVRPSDLRLFPCRCR